MAIAFDASAFSAGSSAAGEGDTQTVSHTLGGGSDRMVVAVVGVETTSSLVPEAPTYNGVTMTEQVRSPDEQARVFIYTLPEASLPAAGTYDAVVDAPAASTFLHLSLYVYSYSGASGTVEATANNGSASASSLNAQITTLTDGARIVGGAACDYPNVQIDATSGQTNVLKAGTFLNGSSAAGDEEIATAGSEAFSWSNSTSGRDWGVAVIALEPAAAAGLNAPTDVVASNPTATTVDLDWTDTNSASKFPRMYRRTPAGSGGFTFVEQLADASATSYTFTGLDPDTEYDFGVSYID